MEEYKSNSYKSKETVPEKKIDKVVSGGVKSKKKSEMRKVADAFIQEDVQSVKTYILMDVLIPAAKKAISDVVTNAVDLILYGETGRSKGSRSDSKISYRAYYDKSHGDRRDKGRTKGYDYDDIIIDNRGEAEKVLAQMDEIIDIYGRATISDLYDLVGIVGNYTDSKYGWLSLRNASVVHVRDGYLLKLPRALPLD